MLDFYHSSNQQSFLLASFPGRLPLRSLDRIHDFSGRFKGHVCGQENGAGDGLGTRLWYMYELVSAGTGGNMELEQAA